VIQAECSLVKHLGELDEGKLHVQFDVEGAGEILSSTLPRTLATLLQGNLVFESYVPPKSGREHRILARHRAGLVKTRTEMRNRIHALLDKHELQHDYSDLFGKQGLEWLSNLRLEGVDQTVLKTNLALLKTLNETFPNSMETSRVCRPRTKPTSIRRIRTTRRHHQAGLQVATVDSSPSRPECEAA